MRKQIIKPFPTPTHHKITFKNSHFLSLLFKKECEARKINRDERKNFLALLIRFQLKNKQNKTREVGPIKLTVARSLCRRYFNSCRFLELLYCGSSILITLAFKGILVTVGARWIGAARCSRFFFLFSSFFTKKNL